MEIITRQQAITNQLLHYFTGQPCKRGHVTHRYTINAACEDCLHPKFVSVAREARLQAREDRQRAKDAKLHMTPQRFRVQPGDLDLWKATVVAYGMMREPALKLSDLIVKRKPEQGFIYTFLVHPDDAPKLRALEMSLEVVRQNNALERAAAQSRERATMSESELVAEREDAISSWRTK